MECLHANSKNYLRYLRFCFSIFSITSFSTEDLEHLSMKNNPFNEVISKCQPKGVFVDLLEKYLGMNAGLWSNV